MEKNIYSVVSVGPPLATTIVMQGRSNILMDIIIDTKRQLHPMEDLEDGNFRRTEKWSEPAHTTL